MSQLNTLWTIWMIFKKNRILKLVVYPRHLKKKLAFSKSYRIQKQYWKISSSMPLKSLKGVFLTPCRKIVYLKKSIMIINI